ncbi:transketolase family protein [bacterium]|nr:transketolase family protein [bacterium]
MAQLNYLNGYKPSSAWEDKLTREGFGDALLALGETNEKVVVLDADLAESTYTKFFRDRYPGRFFECGISENDMINTAAGLAKQGFIPYLASYSMFLAGRSWDQIRNTVDYSYCNVKITAAHGGISVGKDGPTHQSSEDCSCIQPLVNTALIYPTDYWETLKCTKFMAEWYGPMYSRIGREKVPLISSEDTPFNFGKATKVLEGSDITIIGHGLMLSRCILAAEQLAEQGISARVLNMSSVKPIDREAIAAAAGETGGIVVAEEVSYYGSMGSTVATVMAEGEHLVPVRLVAVRDMYLSSGDPYELMDLAGLNVKGVLSACNDVLERRKRIFAAG